MSVSYAIMPFNTDQYGTITEGPDMYYVRPGTPDEWD